MKRILFCISLFAFVLASTATSAHAGDMTSIKIKSVSLNVPKTADINFLQASLVAELQKAGVTRDTGGLEVQITVKKLPLGGFNLDTVVTGQKGETYAFTVPNPNIALWTDGQVAKMTAQRFVDALSKQLASRTAEVRPPVEQTTTTVEIWSGKTGSK